LLRNRVFICGEGGDKQAAVCSRPSAGIPIGANCGGDSGAEPLCLFRGERWNRQQCLTMISLGAELHGEQCRFVQESGGFDVASIHEAVVDLVVVGII
jgi:hypothetical protein